MSIGISFHVRKCICHRCRDLLHTKERFSQGPDSLASAAVASIEPTNVGISMNLAAMEVEDEEAMQEARKSANATSTTLTVPFPQRLFKESVPACKIAQHCAVGDCVTSENIYCILSEHGRENGLWARILDLNYKSQAMS